MKSMFMIRDDSIIMPWIYIMYRYTIIAIKTDYIMMTTLWWLHYDDYIMMITLWLLHYDDYMMMITWWWLHYDDYIMMITLWWLHYDDYIMMITLWWLHYDDYIMMTTLWWFWFNPPKTRLNSITIHYDFQCFVKLFRLMPKCVNILSLYSLFRSISLSLSF